MHDRALSLRRPAFTEVEYESLLAVRTSASADSKALTTLAGDTAARLKHVQALLADAKKQRFADRKLLAFFEGVIQLAAKVHDGAMGVRCYSS